jgi:hypothetical protein
MLKLEEAASKYNFIKLGDGNTCDLEIYADHHMLSSSRLCEARFKLSILNRYGSKERVWSLEFGQWIHSALEYFYGSLKTGNLFDFQTFLERGADLWNSYQMEYFNTPTHTHPRYKDVGGVKGALALLKEYHDYYGNGRERLRIVGTELSFGLEREVPLGIIEVPYDGKIIRVAIFLTGRADMIVDDGVFVGPLDHKSKSYFSGDESSNFKPHEGMIGYAFAVNCMLGEQVAKEGKQCRQTIVNHISLRAPKEGKERFKRTYISYTPTQYADFVERQKISFRRVYELAVLERLADWNTQVCGNIYFRDCEFKTVHDKSPEHEELLLKQYYVIKPEWNPYKIGE